MSDDNQNDVPLAADGLPVTFTMQSHVIKAARKGMRLKAIAARAGMTSKELTAYIEGDREFHVKYEAAIADFEEANRDRIQRYIDEAEAKGDLSLAYKIAREAIKELVDRDNAARPVQVVVSGDVGGLAEPEYEEMSEEELAAIRAETERQDGKED